MQYKHAGQQGCQSNADAGHASLPPCSHYRKVQGACLVDGDRDVQRVLGLQRLGLVDRAARHVQQVLRQSQGAEELVSWDVGGTLCVIVQEPQTKPETGWPSVLLAARDMVTTGRRNKQGLTPRCRMTSSTGSPRSASV